MTRLWVVERKIQINNFIKIKVDYGYLKSSHPGKNKEYIDLF